jgi:hypothetical protein
MGPLHGPIINRTYRLKALKKKTLLWLMKMNERILKAIDLVKTIIPFTLPVKLVVGYFITALGSASVIGFLSEFATYTYAVENGFRLPVEGIPYLKPTISFISLMIIFTSTIVFFLAYTFVRITAFILNSPERLIKAPIELILRIFKKNKVTNIDVGLSLNDVSAYKAVLLSSLASLLATGMLYYAFEIPEHSHYRLHWWTYCMFYVCTLSTYMSAFNKSYVKYIASSIAALSVITIIALMFNPYIYSRFLFLTGFGGGIPTTIYINNTSDKTISGELLIKSNEIYFLRSTDGSIVEYPTKNVIKVITKINQR